MIIKNKNCALICVIFIFFSFQQIAEAQSVLILKFQDALDLVTDTFGPKKCKEEHEFGETMHQLNEWIYITEDKGSLEQYQDTLVDLLDMVLELKSYSNESIEQSSEKEAIELETEKQHQQFIIQNQAKQLDEKKILSVGAVSTIFYYEDEVKNIVDIQIDERKDELTLDQLTERLSRIERVKFYLQKLKEEGFDKYDDYDEVIGALRLFIYDIQMLQEDDTSLSAKRFNFIQKVDNLSTIYVQCFGHIYTALQNEKEIKPLPSENEQAYEKKIEQIEEEKEHFIEEEREIIEEEDNEEDMLLDNEFEEEDNENKLFAVIETKNINLESHRDSVIMSTNEILSHSNNNIDDSLRQQQQEQSEIKYNPINNNKEFDELFEQETPKQSKETNKPKKMLRSNKQQVKLL